MSENDPPSRGLARFGLRGPEEDLFPESDLLAELGLFPGTRLEPRELVGVGGTAEVHRVQDLALRRPVAKKVIGGHLQHEARAQRSFVREARITAQLDHPHIVPVHDIGIDTDGRLYFTMKLVEGRTLAEIVAALPEGPLAHETLLNLLEIVVKVCDALAFAHSRGVLHCDLKPGNVLVGEFGQVHVMDWGVARVLPRATRELGGPDALARRVGELLEPTSEHSNPIAGTPSHMSPEQALGNRQLLDERSDVFLVGATLYNLVTRRPPYDGDTVVAALVRAASGRVVPIERLPGGEAVPRELRRIIERAMQPEPEARYKSVEALRDDLVRFIRGNAEFPRSFVPAGAVVIREGEVGEAAYRIVSGRCLVTIGEGPARQLIREMGAGECFGEMAILSPGPRTATVTALEDTVLEVVTADELEAELSAMRPWMASFIRTLAQRFREREER